MFEAYAKAGGNFIDTANHYTNGTSETFVGEFIAEDRQRFVLSTKYTLNGRPSDPNGGGNHRKSMFQALDASLKRLGTDYIDIYWLHAWDFMTPIEEVMRAIDDLVRAGMVLYIGISDSPAWVIARANMLAELRGWSPFVGLQVPFSLIERTPEREFLPMAESLDIAVYAWGAIGGGVLTGKYRGADGAADPGEARFATGTWGAAFLTERNFAIADEVRSIAAETGRSAAQIALNWVRRSHGVIIPILGARRESQLRDNLGCLEFELSADQRSRLDKVSAIELGFPHDFLSGVSGIVYGETLPLIDNHRAQA